ncbi:hypothetical protein EVAR_101410_1 [Eumeta japonica]|uniref:Uncharacterized protein n=1 Tax=Eumeta variegata TaxID=151549 RepID=A0A4C1TAA6_EUMVA|nr:hypothetical protein EVAR_101410_1 [Eumeta japonica]
MATTKPAPADTYMLLTVKVKPLGAPLMVASPVREPATLDMQIGIDYSFGQLQHPHHHHASVYKTSGKCSSFESSRLHPIRARQQYQN